MGHAARARRYRRARLLGCGLALLGVGAAASTPQAWSAHDREVVDACVGASSVSHAHPAGARVDFDDSVGYSALLIVGRYPQPHMKKQAGRELRLFDRRTRRAVMAEADSLIIRKDAAPPAP
jgi:hypothetical protein